jgi:hypothetical protein
MGPHRPGIEGSEPCRRAGVQGMSVHVHRVSTRVYAKRDDGIRWCFYCRKRVKFIRRVHVPTDPMSYYGPHVTLKCERGHEDGDLFPGRWREWTE